MAEPKAKELPPFMIKVDGDEYELKYSFKAVEWFEAKTSTPYFTFLQNIGVKSICWMILAGVRWQHPQLTYEDFSRKLNKSLGQQAEGPPTKLSTFTNPMFAALRYYGIAAPEEETESPLP